MKINPTLHPSVMYCFLFALALLLPGCGERAAVNATEAVAPVAHEKELTNEDYFAQLQKEAEGGNPESQFNLGWIYMRGEGPTGVIYMRDVPKDPSRAFEWYQKAADQGHVNAQYNLGMLYKLGYGVKEDAEKSFIWLKKAAEQGHDIAQYHLGVMYADGTGVKPNLPRACAWLTLAAAQGNEKARENHPAIDAKLTPAQRDEGLQLAAAWKKGDSI